MDSQLLLYISSAGALFLVVCLGVGCGVVGAMLRVRSWQSMYLALEDRVSLLEGTLQREVKGRAGRERWNAKNPDPLEQQLLEQFKTPPVPEKKYNWWEVKAPRSFTNGK